MKYLTSLRVWGAVTSALSYAAPILADGAFGPKAKAVGVGVGAVLYAIGAKRADRTTAR